MISHIRFFILLITLPVTGLDAQATDYFVHPTQGDDSNNGLSIATAFRTLARASDAPFRPGDRLLLAAGQRYPGTLAMVGLHGHPDQPITVETIPWDNTSESQTALIDAKGYPQALLIQDCQYVQIRSLTITADGYTSPKAGSEMRCGILVSSSSNRRTDGIVLADIGIRDVFYENPGFNRGPEEVRTANGTQSYGWGIRLISTAAGSTMENIRIEGCVLENIEHTGIKLTGSRQNISQVWLHNNRLTRTGGPGIQMSNTKFVHVSSNEISYSGSADDSRKWGRGSGLWTWSASNILIEKNRFLYANGPGDSAGAHIDYNCDNVVLQYNFSAYNAGGFCEILGNTYNCTYRYNISVNDGHRVKGKDGAFQEGKIFWLSGYQGENKERKGPVNTYFYNNTIYVGRNIESKFAIDGRSNGVLIANNIFCIEGDSRTVLGDQNKPDSPVEEGLDHLFFSHNLYLKSDNWPADLPIQDDFPLLGDPGFARKGGLDIIDYLPTNKELVWKKGIKIPYLEDDVFGLIGGLTVDKDIRGRTVAERPTLGALEVE